MRAKSKLTVFLLACAIYGLFFIAPAYKRIQQATPESVFFTTDAGIYLRQGDPVKGDGIDTPGEELVHLQDQTPKPHNMSELPTEMQQGVPAVEDQWFGWLPGINPWRILVAKWRNWRAGKVIEGGSTIHQQAVREFYLSKEKTYERKWREANFAVALWLAKSWREVLGLYSSYVSMGSRGGRVLHGHFEAAEVWYGKPPKDLSIDQMAVVTGMPQAPSVFNPGNPDQCKTRRDTVLKIWLDAEIITPEQYKTAIEQPIVAAPYNNGAHSYASAKVENEARQKIAQQNPTGNLKGMQIYSTIDKYMQAKLQNVVSGVEGSVFDPQSGKSISIPKAITKTLGTNAWQASAVLVRVKTGEVLGYVGGRDYAASQLDHADPPIAPQTGSAFKPFVDAAALELQEDISLATLLPNQKGMAFEFPGFKPYSVDNSGGVYSDFMPLRKALTESENVPHVGLASKVGLEKSLTMARRAGLNVNGLPSDILGAASNSTLKVAEAYTSFINGNKTDLTFIRKITQSDGRVLFQWKAKRTRVMSRSTAFLVTSVLLDVIDHGTGKRLRDTGFKGVVAFKTGSSTSGWGAGYTEDVVLVVNVTFDRPADHNTKKIFGAATAGLIWGGFWALVEKEHPDYIRSNFRVPSEVERVRCEGTPGVAIEEYVQKGRGCGASVITLKPTASPSPGVSPKPDSVSTPTAAPLPSPTVVVPAVGPTPAVPIAPKSVVSPTPPSDWYVVPAPTPKPPSGESGVGVGVGDQVSVKENWPRP